jgi:5-methylcytosine-specific restriction endonuclease McrA
MKSKFVKLRSKADNLWFQVCLTKNPRCFLCGNEARQIHHYKAKSQFAHLRYYFDNGISLCMKCHFALEFKDKSLATEIAKKKGDAWYKNICEMARNRPQYFNFNVKFIESEIAKLEKMENRFVEKVFRA